MCTQLKLAGTLLALFMAAAIPSRADAAHGGGFGGGGFHGGGFGGFHGGGFTGGGFHGGSSFAHFNGGLSGGAPHAYAGGFHGGSFTPAFHEGGIGAHSYAGFNRTFNPGNWHHEANWWRGNGFEDHDRYRGYYGFSPFSYYPFGDFGDWYGWDYEPFWYSYPYTRHYYNYEPYSVPAVTTAYPTYDDQYTEEAEQEAATTGDWSTSFLASAQDAFRQGDYSDALRLASHAAVETPKRRKSSRTDVFGAVRS